MLEFATKNEKMSVGLATIYQQYKEPITNTVTVNKGNSHKQDSKCSIERLIEDSRGQSVKIGEKKNKEKQKGNMTHRNSSTTSHCDSCEQGKSP